ncbi:YkvA family protein [Pantoea sp. LMR881]|uniref:YkvA family protein n=1 Tax=Pantoea sp. LMR881 TaxID=3014336 RepID=UPI0022B05B25|nr:YkvA family protein [Pantoea sp. LMR881]MCZ4060693.1 YkvA family protein [Pantoea sp. LMR881]
MLFGRLRRWATLIKKDIFVLWFAFRDPRTPWWIKLATVGLAGYGISPVDMIPDVIPVMGLLDDAVIIPFGVMALLRLLPRQIRISSTERAEAQRVRGKKAFGWGVLLVVLLWLAVVIYLVKH